MVTAIAHRGRSSTCGVYVDGEFAFRASLSLIAESGLREGRDISPQELEELRHRAVLQNAIDAAVKFLGPRPRSEDEIRRRLRRSKFGDHTIDEVVGTLRAQGLIDDVAFARFWRDNRERFRPRGRRMLEVELRQKGVASDSIAEALEGLEDEDGALKAVRAKSGSLRGLDYASFHRRAGDFLRRRGFGFELVNKTIDQVWQELHESEPDCSDRGRVRTWSTGY